VQTKKETIRKNLKSNDKKQLETENAQLYTTKQSKDKVKLKK